MSAEPLKALILQKEDPTPPGHVTEWLASLGAEADTLRTDLEGRDVDPAAYDLVVSLGSEFAAFDDSKAFVRREEKITRDAFEKDVPFLGLCFGGQMLARVLGAENYRSDTAEIGWLPVRTTDPALVSEGPWFQWHFDVFTTPPGATVVAETDVGVQAFVAGKSLGLQFHPEVTTQIMDDWVREYRHELDEEGVDADALLAETRRLAEQSRANAMGLFDRFLRNVARLRPADESASATG
ncbi:MAG TPA: type 1 glutamine amidotransferase [Actinomycetota bacterium]|nr:type 1 glutamine amidotransferase [Actinomycetota bacterium]